MKDSPVGICLGWVFYLRQKESGWVGRFSRLECFDHHSTDPKTFLGCLLLLLATACSASTSFTLSTLLSFIDSNGAVTIVYSFVGTNDGIYPNSGVIQARDGALYGTTYYGGMYGKGTVFKVTTNGVGTVLHAFGSLEDGSGNDLDGNGPFAG